MPTCAVLDKDGNITNLIMASERDTPPEGFTLREVPEGASINMRYVWSEKDGFQPTPDYQAELDAERAAEAAALAAYEAEKSNG